MLVECDTISVPLSDLKSRQILFENDLGHSRTQIHIERLVVLVLLIKKRVCMVTYIARIWINRVRFPILQVVS